MKEIFKDIKGYEGKYQVSNKGRVRSLARYVATTGGKRFIRERILKENVGGAGYKVANLGFNNSHNVHRLVAETFCDNPNNYPQIMHLDNDKTNNNINNLQWGTQSMNIQQCVRDGRHKGYENGVGKMRHEVWHQ